MELAAVSAAGELSTGEQDELQRCEGIIERGIQTFVEVGEALRSIRDGRLYRATHATFADYCAERWSWTARRAYQLIEAAEVAVNVNQGSLIPIANERQARGLAALPADEQREAWSAVVDLAEGAGITAAQVREVVQQRIRVQERQHEEPLRRPRPEALPLRPDVTIYQGDALTVLGTLPAQSVHCVVTSPPYWGLRDYGLAGQIGLEATPEQHIAALVAVFGEVQRVLRKDGTLWLNYGDCYATAPNGRSAAETRALGRDDRSFRDKPFGTVAGGLKPKDLVLMPHRLALALQAAGWWVRQDVVWHKLNPLPESVTDRPARAHEYVFLLTKSERYFYDADAVREPISVDSLRDTKNGIRGKEKANVAGHRHTGPEMRSHWEKINTDPAGRNRRSVWSIATQPYSEAHFATFPEALVAPCILAGTSEWGCCPECGAPWRRQRRPREEYAKHFGSNNGADADRYGRGYRKRSAAVTAAYETTGWAPACSCGCGGEETVPCVALDPFAGSGTVGKVATDLGRRAILIEISEAYCALARERNAAKPQEGAPRKVSGGLFAGRMGLDKSDTRMTPE